MKNKIHFNFIQKIAFLGLTALSVAAPLQGMNQSSPFGLRLTSYLQNGYNFTKNALQNNPKTAILGLTVTAAATAGGIGYYFWRQNQKPVNQLELARKLEQQQKPTDTYEQCQELEDLTITTNEKDLRDHGLAWRNNQLRIWHEQQAQEKAKAQTPVIQPVPTEQILAEITQKMEKYMQESDKQHKNLQQETKKQAQNNKDFGKDFFVKNLIQLNTQRKSLQKLVHEICLSANNVASAQLEKIIDIINRWETDIEVSIFLQKQFLILSQFSIFATERITHSAQQTVNQQAWLQETKKLCIQKKDTNQKNCTEELAQLKSKFPATHTLKELNTQIGKSLQEVNTSYGNILQELNIEIALAMKKNK